MNKVCKPDDPATSFPIYVQWTSTHNTPLDAAWSANHVVPVVKTRFFVPQRDIQVGDFVTADFVSMDGKVERYRAVIIPKSTHFPDGPDREEICVKCLRAKDNERYYVFPNVDDISCLPMAQIKKIPPTNHEQQGGLLFLTCDQVSFERSQCYLRIAHPLELGTKKKRCIYAFLNAFLKS